MILAADLHLRRTAPRARTDDYLAAQERKFRKILELAQASPPLLVAGDFFHQPRPGEALLRWVIDLLNEYKVKPIVVPGQHDLPYHSLEAIPESGLGVLAAAGVVDLAIGYYTFAGFNISGVAYGLTPPQAKHPGQCYLNILLWHHMIINEPLWPGQEADKANTILKKYPQFDLIVTGDNHQTFAIAETVKIPNKSHAYPINARWLVNPGSMMRLTAAQVNHRPCVFKWEDGGKLEQIFLPIEPDVLDLSVANDEKDKDERIQAFLEQLDKTAEMGLSFEANLERFLQANNIELKVRELVWRMME